MAHKIRSRRIQYYRIFYSNVSISVLKSTITKFPINFLKITDLLTNVIKRVKIYRKVVFYRKNRTK